MKHLTNQYKEAKALIDQGFGVIALTPPIAEYKSGKTPSARSNKYSDLDDNGNPKPLLNADGTISLTKHGKTAYAFSCGGAKNPICCGEETRLYKTFCDEGYTDREFKALNIGIVTGSQFGYIVIDIDGAEGVANLAKLQGLYGDLPETVTATTGRDEGYHKLYQLPKIDGEYVSVAGKNGFIAPAIDIKAEGNYTVAPPSYHHSGVQYQWSRPLTDINISELPECPTWVIELLLGECWHSRKDGLFEAESKDYWSNRKKPSEARVSRKQSEKVSIPEEYSDGFYIYDSITDQYIHFNDITDSDGSTLYCNCFMHTSASKQSLHIDYMADGTHEWYCHSCDEGGRAYTPDEYREKIEYDAFFSSNAYLNGEAEVDDIFDETDLVDDFFDETELVDDFFDDGKETPKKQKTTSCDAESIIPIPPKIKDGLSIDEIGQILTTYKYKDNILPKFISDYIKFCSKSSKQMKGTYLLGILSHYAGALGTNYEIAPNPTERWSEPTVIWGAAVGKSGMIKSGTKKKIDYPFKGGYDTLKKQDKLVSASKKMAYALYHKKYKLWEADPESGIDKMPKPPSPHDFPTRYNFAEDTTLAALQSMAEHAHSGINIFTDELMAFISSFGSFNVGGDYYQKSLLKAYDSYHDYLVKRAGGDKDIPIWHINIFGFCVYADFKKNMLDINNSNDGWSARFLTSIMPVGDVGNNYDETDAPNIFLMKEAFNNMLEVVPKYDKKTNTVLSRKLTFSEEAQKFWIKFDSERSQIVNSCAEMKTHTYGSTFAKQIGQAARLSAIIHLIKFHSHAYEKMEELVVDIDSAKTGCYLSMYYHKHMYTLLFGTDDEEEATKNIGDDEKRAMRSMMKYQEKHAKFRDLTSLSKNLGYKKAKIVRVCDNIKKAKYGNYAGNGKYFTCWKKI